MRETYDVSDTIYALNTTSRYLDDTLNINNVYYDNMVSQIYLSELQLTKANTFDTKATFLHFNFGLDLGLSCPRGFWGWVLW